MKKSYKQDGRPSMQLYPKDILTDFGFLACSLAAQGLWMRMLWIMFFSDERGKLKVNGKQVDNTRLAKIIGGDEGGCDTSIIDMLIQELEDNGVFSRDENGCIYCRRMWREIEESQKKSMAGSKGAEMRWGKHTDGTPMAQGDSKPEAKMATASASSTSSSIASSASSSKETLKPLTDIQIIVEHYKALMGFDKIEGWDKEHFKAHVKAAGSILRQAENLEHARKAINEISKHLEGEGLSWTLHTIAKWVPKWRLGNVGQKSKNNANKRNSIHSNDPGKYDNLKGSRKVEV